MYCDRILLCFKACHKTFVMLRKYVIAGFLCLLLQHCDGRSMMTTRLVHKNDLLLPTPLFNLFETPPPKEMERYTDQFMQMTAIKDSQLSACFINSFDPMWMPSKDDKEYFTRDFECEKLDVNVDIDTLRANYGDVIADMCQDVYIFRIDDSGPPPLLIQGGTATTSKKTCKYSRFPPSTQRPDIDNNSGPNNSGPDNTGTDSASSTQKSDINNNSGMDNSGPDNTGTDNASRANINVLKEPGNQSGRDLLQVEPHFKDNSNELPSTDDQAPTMKTTIMVPRSSGEQGPLMKTGDPAPPLKTGDQAPPLKTGDQAPPLKTGDQAPPVKTGDQAPPLAHNKDNEIAPPELNTHFGIGNSLSWRLATQKRSTIDIPMPPPIPVWKELLARGITFSPPAPDTRTPPLPMALRWMLDNKT